MGDGEGQGGLACYSPWSHKESDTTGRLNNNIPIPGDFVVKNPPAMQETQVQSLGQEDPLEKEMGRGAWQDTVHGVAKSWTRFSD